MVHVRCNSVEDFVRIVVPELYAGNKIVCANCDAVFENDDLAFAHETGACAYCHTLIRELLIKT